MSNLKLLLHAPMDIWLMLISHLPGELGYILRHRHWRKRLKHLGQGTRIDVGVVFVNPDHIHIESNCWIDKNVTILAGIDKSEREKIVIRNKEFPGEPGVVHIGKNVHVGIGCVISGISAGVYISDDCGFSSNCKVYALSHHYRSRKYPENRDIHFGPLVPPDRQCLIEGAIFIGKNTGIALNAVILPGAAIQDHCFVMINTVVSAANFPSNSVISGSPAAVSGQRFN